MDKPHITYGKYGEVFLHVDYGYTLEFESLLQLRIYAKHILTLCKEKPKD